jgi:hypothetical protein
MTGTLLTPLHKAIEPPAALHLVEINDSKTTEGEFVLSTAVDSASEAE